MLHWEAPCHSHTHHAGFARSPGSVVAGLVEDTDQMLYGGERFDGGLGWRLDADFPFDYPDLVVMPTSPRVRLPGRG